MVDSVMLPAHAQTSVEPDGDFFDPEFGPESITSAPTWLNWIIPTARALEVVEPDCEPDGGCARIRNGVITLVVHIRGFCYNGEGQVGQTVTLEPIKDPYETCETIAVDILDFKGRKPNRVLVVGEGRELAERTDLECDCSIFEER